MTQTVEVLEIERQIICWLQLQQHAQEMAAYEAFPADVRARYARDAIAAGNMIADLQVKLEESRT